MPDIFANLALLTAELRKMGYALRRELFWREIPENTIVDDFVIVMKVCEEGRRMLYEAGALAYEDLPETVEDEWGRRVRIGAGDYLAVALCRACLHPRYKRFAWIFWSQKVLSWFTPQILALFLLVSLAAMSGTMCTELWYGSDIQGALRRMFDSKPVATLCGELLQLQPLV